MEATQKQTKLRRSLGLTMITFYGLGTIVGGGFYGLVGKVSAEAGMLTPLAFLTAALVAMFSAFSFAELSARFPYSAGEAHYALAAFHRKWLSSLVGWMVIVTGIVSAAALADIFSGMLRTLIPAPAWLVVCVMVIGLGVVAAWGIGESAVLALLITIAELAGLLFVFCWGCGSLASLPQRWASLAPSLSLTHGWGIVLGAYLSFYSFVGFEDMVNLAEEVKQPQRNLPRAIMLSLGVTTVLYVCVTLVTVLAVPPDDLRNSDAPLALVVGGKGSAAAAITTIGMFSGLNGALVQIVMASRVAYGMATRQQAPAIFAVVHPQTQTPLAATIAAMACVLLLALALPVVALAKGTSTILLAVYAIVNLSLWRIKRRERLKPAAAEVTSEMSGSNVVGPRYPTWLPLVGFLVCCGFIAIEACSMLGF